MCKRLITLLLFLTFTSGIYAQRVTYPELLYQSEIPDIFINELIIPQDSTSSILAFTFRFNYDFLSFKKLPLNHSFSAPEGAQFFTTLSINSEIFKGKVKSNNEALMKSVSRDAWADTVFANTFEETQSSNKYAAGILTTKLTPGYYNFILQLNIMQEQNDRSTQRQNIHIPKPGDTKTGEVYLIGEVHDEKNLKAELMNLNDNVPFGENFHALIRIPDYEQSASYQIEIRKASIQRRDTVTASEVVHTQKIKDDQIYSNTRLDVLKSESPALVLTSKNKGFTYILAEIPNEKFENSMYYLHLKKEGDSKVLAKQFFRSYWPDMPASLYNLDIAINMLRFIVNSAELEKLKQGNNREKEQKFRQFWDSKDPTPNTVYNELMAEYYRRIDYAFKTFGSPENPMGHESDQGKIYIKFGPPDSKERVYPTNGNVRELWKYDDRTFVFEATTGFGDYVLIGSR